jgi:hypothetical protein
VVLLPVAVGALEVLDLLAQALPEGQVALGRLTQ